MVPKPASTLPPEPLAATNNISGFRVRPGLFLLNGANVVPGGVSFTIHSINATYCELCLFRRTSAAPSRSPSQCSPFRTTSASATPSP